MRQTVYWYLYRYSPRNTRLEDWAWKRWLSTGWQRAKRRNIDMPTEDTTSYDPMTELRS